MCRPYRPLGLLPKLLARPSRPGARVMTMLARLLLMLLVLTEASAFARLPRPHEGSTVGPRGAAGCTRQRQARVAVPQAGLATADLVPVIAAVVLTAAAGLLQYSVSAGDRGINAYLSKEKGENPFYNYRSSRPPAQGRPRPGEEER
mgnify:CR=1 FL=1